MKMVSRSRAIDKVHKRRDRYDIPDWQREEVWSRSKKQNLIDSILHGWKLPKFYFLKTSEDPEEFEVVDGQQRLSAIFEFFDDALELSEDSAQRFGAKIYSELPDATSDAFDDFEIEYDEITDATDDEVKGFFQRLQEGLPLTSSEKLNSIPSNLVDYLRRKASHPFFMKVSVSNRRYGHFDVLAKVAAIEIDGIEVGLRFDELRAMVESQSAFSDRSNVARRIDQALDFLDRAFSNEQASRIRNRTMLQSLLTLTCRLRQSVDLNGREALIADFFDGFVAELGRQVELGHSADDPDYLTFQRTVNANVKSGAQTRQVVLLQKLLAHEPGLIESFDAAVTAETGLSRSIRENGIAIGDLVEAVNRKYSATNGDDLFKATNKTIGALQSIGQVVADEDGFGKLIDDLYFLFHEGPGDRLSDSRPVSFTDVNTLRTEIRHDTDHGKATKVRSKKKKAGATFAKYAGESSPEGLAPERFAVVQLNVLKAIRRDLKTQQESL
jgi:hypothetical protein